MSSIDLSQWVKKTDLQQGNHKGCPYRNQSNVGAVLYLPKILGLICMKLFNLPIVGNGDFS